MKVQISNRNDFSNSFKNQLIHFLKREFIRHIGMEVKLLFLPTFRSYDTQLGEKYYYEIYINKEKLIYSINDLSLNYYGSRSIKIDLYWQSKTGKLITGREEVQKGDVVFWQEGLENERIIQFLREQIQIYFKKEYITGYRFVVEVESGFDRDVTYTINLERKFHQALFSFLEEKVNEYNDRIENLGSSIEEGGLIHGIFTKFGKSNKLKIQMDLGSSGLGGFNYVLQVLEVSDFPIEKVLIH